jgi:hypothetical protein
MDHAAALDPLPGSSQPGSLASLVCRARTGNQVGAGGDPTMRLVSRQALAGRLRGPAHKASCDD